MGYIPVGQSRTVFDIELIDERPSLIVLQVTGKEVWRFFRHEAGSHRWQRIPSTEKRDRVHTSTITVTLLALPKEETFKLEDRDLDWQATRGSGAGGQKRNKTSSAVILTHRPTGLVVRIENERSQHHNLCTAKAILAARLQEALRDEQQGARNHARRAQVGNGRRCDKRRTVALQRDQIVDHVLGLKMSAERYLKGDLSDFYKSSQN